MLPVGLKPSVICVVPGNLQNQKNMKSGVFTFVITALLLFRMPVSSQNLLSDGDFSSTTEFENAADIPATDKWQKFVYDVGAEFAVVDGVCEIKVNYPGTENWQAQLLQGISGLETDHKYNLSFDVKASSDCWYVVFLGEVNGNWTTFLDGYWHNAGTGWQTISIDFVVPFVFEHHKLSFEFGNLNNTTIYFDNVSITDLGTFTHSVGIIGPAVNGGWDVDVDMETTDGIIYTLNDFPLNSGFMKFRQDNFWFFNWGYTGFPAGFNSLYKNDIPVPNPGRYNITFNRETGDYVFECVNECIPFIGITGSAVPPDFGVGQDVKLSTNDGINYRLSNYTFFDGTAIFRQDDNPELTWGSDGFPKGVAVPDGDEMPITAGTYNVLFNRETGEYSFEIPGIGILGSALNGWDTDIDMETLDGIVYTLNDYPFNDGYVKFRYGDSWSVNWGGYDFPAGYAEFFGPDIPVMAGTYNVTLNLQTNEYFFEATSCPFPEIVCPYDLWEMAELNSCERVVFYPEVKAAANCGGEGITIEQIEGLPSGSVFPVGQTLNSFKITNKDGNTAWCSFYVIVMEPEFPVITLNNDWYEPLWPPDHKMVNFYLDYTVSNNCTLPHSYLFVYCNEPETGMGEGDKSPDWEIIDEHNVLLRAERSAQGTGREYYIFIVAYNDSWNYDFRMITVKVPHDQGFVAEKQPGKNKSANIESKKNTAFTLEIWPNPTEKLFNLKVKNSEPETLVISVTDLTGRVIDNFGVNSDEAKCFGEKLNPGIYIVSARKGTHIQIARIVKTQ